jgi:hypothetical protein
MTILAVAALLFVLIDIDPEAWGVPGKAIFFAAVFFSSAGMFNLALISIRQRLISDEMAVGNLGISFRQGILMALLLTTLLILQSFRMLVWWDGMLALAGVFLIELYFLSRG